MPAARLPDDLRHEFATVNGVRMHYVEAGTGDCVLFLHGFPQSWYAWRHQLGALADRYRVAAPDLRGYNETDRRPPYDTDTLVADVLALMDRLGERRVHLVGHDWGGVLAWLVAAYYPDRVRTLTVCNAPHPAVFRRAIWQPRQLLRSFYIFLFQVPWLPERLLASRSYHRLARFIINDTRPGTFTREDVRFMLASWRRQGLGGGIDWYRAAFRRPRMLRPTPRVTVPALLIWGEDDAALGVETIRGTEKHAAHLRVELLANVSHWVQEEEPEAVTALIRQHIGGPTAE